MRTTELEATLIKKVTAMQQEMERREARLIALLQQQSEQQKQLAKQVSDLQRQLDALVKEYEG